jgi:hypothetical protein
MKTRYVVALILAAYSLASNAFTGEFLDGNSYASPIESIHVGLFAEWCG